MPEITEKHREVFEFSDLSNYSLKQRILIRLADIIFYCLVWFICKTIKFEVEGWEHFEACYEQGRIPILNFWHDRIFTSTYFFRGRQIVVMSSISFDAEYIGRFIKRFGYGTIRGSSNKRASAALIGMIRIMRDGFPTGFSIDGPRGPRYIAKPGSCTLAKKTGNPLIPFTIHSKKFWVINSWDKLQIPKPFTRAKVFIGKPIFVPADANEKELENKRQELQNTLDEQVNRVVQWL